MPTHTFDPTLSALFLNFQAYSETISINFNDRIRQLYNYEPIYFSPISNVEINTQLRIFTDSSQFEIFTSQLDDCISNIVAFAISNNIQVTTTMPELTHDPSGQTQIEVNASRLLDRFLLRLKSDYYASRRANLYASGKRYLEMLSILIEEVQINLDDRITQLKALIDDDALEKCADGCYSRLQETVENLEAIIVLDAKKWIKNFLKNQLTESIQKSISSLTDTTLTEKIADIMGRSSAGFEIHYHNWLVEILRNALGFSFIKQSKDTYVDWISKELVRPENSDKKTKVFEIIEQGKKKLIQSITATHLVEFISHGIYQAVSEHASALESSVRYSELVNTIESKLAVLGADDTFSLGEIFDFNGELKSEISFYKTITLRLLNKGFFRQPIEFLTNHYQLAFFEKNLPLSLITVLSDGEISRIIDFVQQPDGLMHLLDSVAVERRSQLFNHLIQSTEDFIVFLNSVDSDYLHAISSFLSGSLDSLGLSKEVIQDAMNQPKSEFLSKFEGIFTILENLNGILSESGNAKHFFYEQMINPRVFDRLLAEYLKLRLRLNADEYSVLDVQTILDKLLVMRIPAFNDITFYAPQFVDADLQSMTQNTYLKGFGFDEIKLQGITIEVPVEDCYFTDTTIQKSYFHERVNKADFSNAKLDDVHFKSLHSSKFVEGKCTDIKLNQLMENCDAREATFENAFLTRTHKVSFKSATLLNTQFGEVSECNFIAANLFNTEIKSAKDCNFLEAKLDNVAFGEILDNVSSRSELFSFRRAELKRISFSSIDLHRDKIDFSYAQVEDSIFKSLDLSQAIFKGSSFKNVLFNRINFNNYVFKKIKFDSGTIFDNCELIQATFRNCDLTMLDLKKNNLLIGSKLEKVTLTPYQLITFHTSQILDYSTVTLVDDPTKTPLEIEIFLSMCRLDGARFSPQIFWYLCAKNFSFRGVNLRHIDIKAKDLIDLKEKGLTYIDLKGATVTFTQALQLHEHGFGNFLQTTIFIEPNSIEENVQKLKAFISRNEATNEEAKKNDIEFLIFLFEKVNNDLVEKALNNEALIVKARGNLADSDIGAEGFIVIANMQQEVEAQRQACQEIAKIIFTQSDTQQQQTMLEKMTEHVLQRDALGEGMAAEQLRFLRTALISSLSEDVLSDQVTFFSEKFFQISTSDEKSILNEILNDLTIAIVSRCGDLGRRKKRSAVECAGLDELINVDETQAIAQAKEITLLVAAERRLLWQKNIRPLLNELNQAGQRWYPLLETAQDLGNDRETIEFINVRTQEKQTHELSGKSSLNFLASLRELHQFIPQEKFRENVKNFADDLMIKELPDQFRYDENNFSGDFLLAIGLTTKTIINLINNKGCTDNVNNSSSSTVLEHVECAVNIASMSALYLTVTLQLTELIQKDFLTQESLLLKGLSVTNKVFGGINFFFLLTQDGLDIFKLVQASSEKETAEAVTQLVIDGTLTVQTFVSLVAEGLIASVSAALIVPFMGLGVGLPSLINNYETLLEMALQTGRFFNTLHEQQKKGGYEWVTQTKLKDDNGNEHVVLLNYTQRYMKPVDMVVTTKVDFVNQKLVLEGPWIYSSMNRGLCYYVDHNKDNAFDFREGVGLPNTTGLSATHLSIRTWLLPYPNFYINYEYQQEPFITLRNDAELDTLRELQKNKEFISDKSCFIFFTYGIYKYYIEYVPTKIKIVADDYARTFIVPTLDRKLHGLLTYEMDTRGLEEGQGIIYLNPGVSIHLYLTQYSWILNGQNLSEDTIEFAQQGLRVGDVVIKELFEADARTASNNERQLTYINKQGHSFRLHLEQKQMLLMTINYAALQKSQQTLDEFLMHQQPNSPVVRVINYHNPDNGFQGTATYVVAKKRLFYTLNSFEHANDAVLISLQKQAAFFYDENSRLLWCTETQTNRLLHYYVFPEEINSVSQQGDDLLINVANQFYYTINTVTKQSLLMAVQNANLLTLFLTLHAKLSLIDVNYTDNRYKFDVTQTKEGQELIEQLQTLIRSTLMEARQAGSLYQKIDSEMKFPLLNDSSIGLRVASNVSPFIWLRKEKDHYQLISMQNHPLDENALENNEYRKANIKSGKYLGCFFDSQQPDIRILSYFVKENSTDTTGKLYLQTVNAQQMLVSFDNTPPRLLVDLLVKNAVWNDNKLVVLTADNTYQAIDAFAQTSLIGFTADWVQENSNWWQAVAVYLEKHSSKQVLISVQGIKDQRGDAVIVYYDHRVQQFIIINHANFDAVYCGKIGKVYFFTKDNCAYQVQGMTAEQIQALFNGPQAKQSLPAPTKIADYHPLSPLGTPTENDQLLMQKLPKFYFALQEFRVWLPQGVELAFDPKDVAWRVLAIQAGWFNQQQNLPKAVIDLFSHIAKLFKLKENQLHTPIPIETTDFCLVENDRFIEIPDVSWPNEQFNYLGQTDQPGYYFYDASRKAIILLTSTNRNDFEKSHSHSIKPALEVEYAAKLNEASALLEIDPLHIDMQDIPLFKGCHQLLLMLTAHKNDQLITLPERLIKHYTTVIYQAEGANPIKLPGYAWFARKNQHSLMLSNGYSQLVIPYASDNTVPNIMIQVNYVHANQSQVFKENTLLIDRKLDRLSPLNSIPILGYGLNWIEEVRLSSDAAVGHYQKENLAVESVAVKLSGQPMPEKVGSVSFLSQALVATVSAMTSFALTTAMGLSYVFVRRFCRPAPATAIKNTLVAVSIPMTHLPTTEAQAMSNEDNNLVSATVENLNERLTAEDFQNGFYESEIHEQGFSKLTQSWSSVAGILAVEFKKRREERSAQLDVGRKIRLKQIEHLQAHHTLHTLTDAFIAGIEAKLKKATHANSTELKAWVVNDLMAEYRNYLNDSVSESALVKKFDIWFNTFLSEQKEAFVHDRKLLLAEALGSVSFSAFIKHLFIDKVCHIYQDRMIFSEKKELAEKQKVAVLKIMPSLLQSEEAFVASLSVSKGTDFIALAENSHDKQRFELACKSKQSIAQKYLPNSGWVVNYFKPVNATEIEKTMSSKKILQ